MARTTFSHWQARAHFIARGLDPDLARRCPMDPAKDGPHGFKNRNGRMHRTHRPSLAAAFISGKVGSPMTAGSAHMLGICLAAKTPVVVYRDNGVEPHAHLGVALSQLRRLYAVTRDSALVIPGQALAAHCEVGDPPADEVIAALAYARDGSRWAPWIEAKVTREDATRDAAICQATVELTALRRESKALSDRARDAVSDASEDDLSALDAIDEQWGDAIGALSRDDLSEARKCLTLAQTYAARWGSSMHEDKALAMLPEVA